MDPANWTKSPTPVFTSNDTTKQYGPGHNCFTVAEDGRTDVLVYHARQYKDIVGDPLNDPNRHTRVQTPRLEARRHPRLRRPRRRRRPPRTPGKES